MMFYRILFWLFVFTGCKPMQNAELSHTTEFHKPPDWAKEAIWYQIFIERFRDGNANNNPTINTCRGALRDTFPKNWVITPWGHDWYTQEDWAKATGLDFYTTIQMRRYGGDLDGVKEKIPYLKDLGINAIYFNPLNDAPSLHKYDARNYHHIDVTLGDDINTDIALMSKENPEDSNTWAWTTADKKFINLVKELHSEGIRVVLDFSWNHTGKSFWAFRDIEQNLENSPYKDWYETHFFKDEATGKTHFTYEGWIGFKSLPELKKVNTKGKIQGHPFEGNLHPEVKKHIFEVTKRWLDPNGDGKFDDGIDGMRLDVAEHVPTGFWEDFRIFVRSINPDFYLVGENWWTKWPDILMDPAPWVKGNIFDAVMHYQWYKVARGYFAQPEDNVNLPGFRKGIDSLYRKYPDYTQQAMMNLSASHDAPRLLTCFANPIKYKYNAKPQENIHYKTTKPDSTTYHRVKLFLLHQFTFVGSPHIWNGDEMGMTGADDPDCRKPLAWPDKHFTNESGYSGNPTNISENYSFDKNMFDYYSSLIKLRKSSKVFSLGSYQFLDIDDQNNILAYTRTLGDKKIAVIFNINPKHNQVTLPYSSDSVQNIFQYGKVTIEKSGKINLPPFSGAVFSID